LTNLTIEEERSLRVQYKFQDDNERKAKKTVESNMREYSRANALRDRVSTIQSELEFREEEVKKIKEHFEE
jgi:ATP-dependent Lon protease